MLVIEDDPRLAALLGQELASDGYRVTHAATGCDGLLLAERDPPDLTLLDLGLPDLDGLEVAERLARRRRTPILMITARGSVDDRVDGIYAGASDYLVKPFSIRELLARMHAILRDRDARDVIRYRNLALDRTAQVCLVDGAPLELSAREFALLEALLADPGRVFSRSDLAERLYRDEELPESNAVEVFVSRLRTKLRRAGAPGLIRTVRGVGYATRA